MSLVRSALASARGLQFRIGYLKSASYRNAKGTENESGYNFGTFQRFEWFGIGQIDYSPSGSKWIAWSGKRNISGLFAEIALSQLWNWHAHMLQSVNVVRSTSDAKNSASKRPNY